MASSKQNQQLSKKQQEFIDKHVELGGNISKTCKAVGINRGTYYQWMEKSEDFADAVALSKDALIDEIEDILMKKIRGFEHTVTAQKVDKEGNVISFQKTFYFPPCTQSIQYKLNAIARHRGYGRKPDDAND